MQNSYSVISASAGSGKTYTLVQRLLMICLGLPKQHKVIRNILALTFTNKAANEMKERILNWLGKFAAADYGSCRELAALKDALAEEGKHVTLDDLHIRSKKMLDYVLHNYSTLNIGTIDKFNSRLVRSFSYELGLAKNFNLEIQAEPFLIEAVDQMLNQVGQDKEISDALIDFVNYGLDNEKRINLNKTLYNSAKEFVKDIHYENLKNNSTFDSTNYKAATKKLREEIKKLREENITFANTALSLIREKGLENGDFAGGGNQSIQYFFDSYLANDTPKLYGSSADEEKKINHYYKGASATGKYKEHLILEIIDFLVLQRSKIIQNHITIQKKEKILAALLPLKVNKDIQLELGKIEEENDVVLLSKFNILINENLKNEPSPFIYEKIGSQFQHYFFDEFQDTSVLQWQNFVPLRDHSVSENGTSFTVVGDPKQSIYRFRGGESKLMLGIINQSEITPKKAEVRILEQNWRSAKNIVKFNNALYQHIADNLSDEHKNIFGVSAQQHYQEGAEGRVKVSLIENGKKEEFYEDTAERMQRDIQDLVNNGFRLSDITILCRGNRDIFDFSQKLGALTVVYHGNQVNIKTISESGLTLELSDTLNAVMQFLNWEANPKNMQHLTLMMYYLNRLGRIKMHDFTEEILDLLKIKNRNEIILFIREKYDLELDNTDFPRLNLYNFVEFYLHEFSVKNKETDFLLNFLEVLYAFTQNSGANLKDFIKFWNDEAREKSIQASENIDAVQLMTIHKAKGLEFPVVFYPMLNSHRDHKFNDWFDADKEFGLHSVNMAQFSRELEVYDPQIREFNEANVYKNHIDRVCLQYVATTRPVEQLFLYIQKAAKTNHLEILDFVEKTRPSNADEFDYFDTSDVAKQSGPKTFQYNTEAIESITRKLEKPSAIRIATPSKSYQNRNEKVRQGIFTHEILSKINSEKEVDHVLERYVLDGTLTLEEKDDIMQSVLNIIKKYPAYFGEHLDIINEQDIMITENGITSIYRPDRIIKSDKGYVILDFKTGAEHPKHQQQIETYRRTVEGLGIKVADTAVVYL
jgi:ATP-dependent exoDNAse (exonuclease V) beta subunit